MNQFTFIFLKKIDVKFLTDFFESAFVTPPAFPQPVLQHLVNQTNPNIPFMNGLIKQVETGADFRMNEVAQKIRIPALVLWGKQDPIVPIEYGQMYTDNLENARLVVLENVGHAAQFEIPERIQSALKKRTKCLLTSRYLMKTCMVN